ncbi:ResB-like family protein [Anaerohalosphaera lusitana]|uniref:ResB-like family protein n=1 Tax=Anaerohalosphaera lusitana TaxID=1936003 RepID=A0A1U9NLR0_9BACT|nr:cytochrome c biogenesis protein ResB [Anaerohalosphaera lusitana]AQT68871.1 ResB-like family protein [Anaerohalosphaera lusitana]
MSKLRQIIFWLVLTVIAVLIGCSVYGAFIGADRAEIFFNSLPLASFWVLFLLLLAAGFAVFPALWRKPALLLCHLGPILVLIGGLWGSQTAHELRREFGLADKLYKGKIAVLEGEAVNEALLPPEYEESFELPFSLRLKDFRIEYYPIGSLVIQSRPTETRPTKTWNLPAEIGKTYSLTDGETVEIVKVYRNFKITIEDGQVQPKDVPGPAQNPAVEVILRDEEGNEMRKYAFQNFPGHIKPEDQYALRYNRNIKDFISEADILVDGEVQKQAEIEVNHPLYYDGYHLYQSEYRQVGPGSYMSILSVVSDRGLYFVWAGYAALCLGIVWQLWFVKLVSKISRRRGGNSGN